jgi:hypothetical protein
MIANPGISVNPNQSPNENARYLFMVDLLNAVLRNADTNS